MASKSKGKMKLKKKEFDVEGKIINLELFAYDVFAYSAAKFGIPSSCICKLKDGEIDYGLPNFIVVLSRFIFRIQIKRRNHWYAGFKRYYESTKFKTFESIKTALRQVMYDTANSSVGPILYDVIITLALMCELIQFLYAENCSLYPKELARYWYEYWCSRKKEVEKAGGLADLYQKFNNPVEEKVDIFFNDFILVYCNPYDGSRCLQEVFDQEFDKFFNLSAENMADMEKAVQEEAERKNEIISKLAFHLSEACEASKQQCETSSVHIPRNTGLGIPKHEDLLRNVLGTNTETSPKDVKSKSGQKTAGDRRGSSGKKERQKKISSPQSTEAGPGPLKTGLMGAEASISLLEEDSENETPRNTGLGIQTHDDLLRDVFGAETASSPQEFSSKHRQKMAEDRRGSPGQKERQKKKTGSHSSLVNPRQLHTSVLGAEAATSPLKEESDVKTPANTGLGIQTHDDLLRDFFGADVSPQEPSSTSRLNTAKDRKGSTGKKDKQKKISSLRSTVASPESLRTGLLGADLATPPQNISCLSPKKSVKDRRGSSRQKEPQEFKTKSLSNLEDINPYFEFLGGHSAATIDKRVGVEIPKSTGLGIQTSDDMHRDVFGTDIASSPVELSSTSTQNTAEDPRGSSIQMEIQEKRTSSRPILDDLTTCLEYLGLPLAPKLDEDLEAEMPRNTGLGIQTHDLLRDGSRANIASSPRNASSASRQKTRDIIKEKLKKITSPRSTVEVPERLKTSPFGTGFISPPKNLSSATFQDTERDRTGSFSQKDKLKKTPSPCSSVEGSERLKTSPFGADAATSPQTREDSEIEALRNADFGKLTPEEIIQLMCGDKLASSDLE